MNVVEKPQSAEAHKNMHCVTSNLAYYNNMSSVRFKIHILNDAESDGN